MCQLHLEHIDHLEDMIARLDGQEPIEPHPLAMRGLEQARTPEGAQSSPPNQVRRRAPPSHRLAEAKTKARRAP